MTPRTVKLVERMFRGERGPAWGIRRIQRHGFPESFRDAIVRSQNIERERKSRGDARIDIAKSFGRCSPCAHSESGTIKEKQMSVSQHSKQERSGWWRVHPAFRSWEPGGFTRQFRKSISLSSTKATISPSMIRAAPVASNRRPSDESLGLSATVRLPIVTSAPSGLILARKVRPPSQYMVSCSLFDAQAAVGTAATSRAGRRRRPIETDAPWEGPTRSLTFRLQRRSVRQRIDDHGDKRFFGPSTGIEVL